MPGTIKKHPATAALNRFANNRSGAVAIMVALLFPVLVGGMALGTEAGFWYLSQRKLQQASDMAAYAAAVQLRAGRGESDRVAAATAMAAASGFRVGEDVLVPSYPRSNAVEIRLTRQQTRFFTLIYANDTVEISARAVAEVRGGGNACLLALDQTAGAAITVTGSAEVTFDGCDVATNSAADDAFYMWGGNVELTAGCVHSVGGVKVHSEDNLNLTSCTTAREEAPVILDPYADIAEPSFAPCTTTNNTASGTVTPTETHELGMLSKRFCGGLDVTGDVEFRPGLYIISGGSFRINGNRKVTGNGVTFFLTNGATLDFNGTATIDLKAPETGPLAGILFFGDRNDVSASHKLNGNAGQSLSGAVYLPSANLDYSGNFGGANSCTQIVTRTIRFTGNSSLSVDCTAAGTRRIAVAETIALVE